MKMKLVSIVVESPYDNDLPDNKNFIEFETVSESLDYMRDFLSEPERDLQLNEETFSKFFQISLLWSEVGTITSKSLEPLDYDEWEVESLAHLKTLID